MKNPTQKSFEIEGSHVSYFIYHPNKKRVIVMIHGFRGDHHGLQFIAEHLKDFCVIVPDLPGFGQSTPMSRQHDIDGYTAFLARFITQLGLSGPPILLGHSFGSIICASYGAQYPETISKLILVNPIAEPALESGSLAWLADFYYWLGKNLPKNSGTKLLRSKLIVRLMSHNLAKTKDKELLKLIHGQHLRYFSGFHDRTSLHEAYRASTENHVGKWAAELQTPVLLIAGEKDNIAPLATQKRLHRKITKSKLKIIPGSGHLVHYETPARAAEIITVFSLH